MRILLLGKVGQLGWELNRCLQPLGEIFAVDYPEIDLTKPKDLRERIRAINPQVIINATAYTAVDRAENEANLARAINAIGSAVIAEEAVLLGAAMIHYSTDYVFDGKKGAPYVETDTPQPLNVYGKTKLEGEQAIQSIGGAYLIFRTAWVYSTHRESFVYKVLHWARQKTTLEIVDDQISNPTWARALAEITALLLARSENNPVSWLGERRGLYHLAGAGYTSRYEWARAILRLDQKPDEQLTKQVAPVATSRFPTPAERPLFSALDCSRFEGVFGVRLPAWDLALELAMDAVQ